MESEKCRTLFWEKKKKKCMVRVSADVSDERRRISGEEEGKTFDEINWNSWRKVLTLPT